MTVLLSIARQQVTKARPCLRTLSTIATNDQYRQWQSNAGIFLAAATGGMLVLSADDKYTFCKASEAKKEKLKAEVNDNEYNHNPSFVGKQDFAQAQAAHDINALPEYTLKDVAAHDGKDGSDIWMSYGGVVYNVTKFIVNHPGGSEKILLAAGGAIEPFWHYYRQHFASDLPMRIMENMAIGRLAEADQDRIDADMEEMEKDDPYAKEPMRHRALIVHSDTPMNAEVPAHLLTKNYLTPNSLFYIRHHHPVPFLTEKEVRDYRLTIDLSPVTKDKKSAKQFTLDEIKAMKPVEVEVTLQCSGNRRDGYNGFSRTSGTPWNQGAISTAKFKGVRLSQLLQKAGLDCTDPIQLQEDYKDKLQHVRFHALDGMMASVGFEKAVNPYGDCIVAYEMNGEPLPRDHGFPLRVIVPGYAAVRNVKWVSRIEVADTEAEGPWQRGLNYKTLPPNVTDAKDIDLQAMPSMTEVSLFSGITRMQAKDIKDKSKLKPGETITYKTKGWAWSGGGRNIVRVDVTGDGGKTWTTAKLTDGTKQKFGRAWAWTFWECEVPAVVRKDGTVEIASKAVDMAFNVQPEKSDHSWNVRGLGNNSWYRLQKKVVE